MNNANDDAIHINQSSSISSCNIIIRYSLRNVCRQYLFLQARLDELSNDFAIDQSIIGLIITVTQNFLW